MLKSQQGAQRGLAVFVLQKLRFSMAQLLEGNLRAVPCVVFEGSFQNCSGHQTETIAEVLWQGVVLGREGAAHGRCPQPRAAGGEAWFHPNPFTTGRTWMWPLRWS